jgi:hypothetical protein
LLQSASGSSDVDLYGVIMHQLDQGDESIDLDQLMKQLISLFQKNQIGIRIRLL